jgi:hypothetical protein
MIRRALRVVLTPALCLATLPAWAQIPSSEQTHAGGWAGPLGEGTIHQFWQRLLPTHTNFSGRQVIELGYATGNDTCWFPGSQVPPSTQITGGSWI